MRLQWPYVRFALIHLACLGAIWTGVSGWSLLLGAAVYAVLMFGVTAGYHRYFSHRAYKTSRPMQFVLAWLAVCSAQKGVLWWASHHRKHHKHSDTERDVHSPVQRGFWFAHVVWFLKPGLVETDHRAVKDLARHRELHWFDHYYYVPPVLAGLAIGLVGGWEAFFVGFVWPLVACWHATFTINSLAHIWGRRTYDTKDHSRNNLVLALLTHGEGWHNNHHHYQLSCRQGFRWYQVDVTWYVLRVMAALRLVWDLREPPGHVLQRTRQAT